MRYEPSSSMKALLSALLLAASLGCGPSVVPVVDPVVDPVVEPGTLGVVSTAPSDGAMGVKPSTSLVVQFSAPVDSQSVSVSIAPAAALGVHQLSADGTELRVPGLVLAPDTAYTITLSASGKAGETLPAAHTLAFTTGGALDTMAPSLLSSSPGSGAQDVAVGLAVSLTFSEPMDTAGLVITADPEHDFGAPVWSANDTVATFPSPPAALVAGQRYALTFQGADRAGNALQAAAPVTFTVETPVVTTPPTVVASTPAADATNVSTSTSVSVTFSEAMDASTVDAAISLSPASSGIVSWDATNTLRTLQAKGLVPNTLYTLTVGGGAKDASGTALAAPFVMKFTTGALPDTTRPEVASSSPAAGELGVARTDNIRVTFSEPMDKASAQAAFSITAPAGYRTGTFSWSADGLSMTFNPNSTFPYGEPIAWRVTTAAQDLAGNPLQLQVSRGFNVIRQGTLVLNSVAASDGHVYSDQQALPLYNTLHAGVANTGLAVRGFLTFNLAALPATTQRITLAAVYLYQMQLKGDPVAVLGGTARLERLNYGETLEGADYNASPFGGLNDSVAFTIGSVSGWRGNSQVALGVWQDWNNRATRGNLSQFRLRYPNAVSGANQGNYVSFNSGEAPDVDCPRPSPYATGSSCKPHLIIVYEYK